MIKPNSYDDVKASGEFVPVSLGGHYAVIKQVVEQQSKTGKDMIVVLFDFCSPDSQDGYFAKQFNNDVREDKKWPNAGRKYVMVKDFKDPNLVSKDFKTFCSCVEKSNHGFTVQWMAEGWGNQFKGKKIGVVFGLEEDEYNGVSRMRPTAKWFRSFDNVTEAEIPAPKYKNGSASSSAAPAPAWTQPTEPDEDLPF